jgi:hypothetical protein
MGKVTWRNANGEEVLILANVVGLLNRRNMMHRDRDRREELKEQGVPL